MSGTAALVYQCGHLQHPRTLNNRDRLLRVRLESNNEVRSSSAPLLMEAARIECEKSYTPTSRRSSLSYPRQPRDTLTGSRSRRIDQEQEEKRMHIRTCKAENASESRVTKPGILL